jgi:DNA polymerase III delta prime subunit
MSTGDIMSYSPAIVGGSRLQNQELRYSDVVSSRYVPRLADELIADLLAEFPALLLVGPRASGKATTAVRHARTVYPPR